MAITSSTGDASTGGTARRRAAGSLARYLAAATLARGADAGAPVGLALLATSAGLRHGAAVGGLLAAALTAPHLLGPWVAGWVGNGRKALAGAFAGYALAVAGAALALGRAPVVVAVAVAVVAGAAGPLLTGGLSSRLGEGGEGWDAVSYGLGGTGGPALVALAASAASPLAAVLSLAGAAAVAAPLTLALPPGPRSGDPPPAHAALRLLARHPPLRRVNLMAMLTAFAAGGLAVIAAVLGHPALVAAFGLGNLAGSGLVTAFPLRGEPVRLTRRGAAGVAAALGLCAAAPGVATFALAGLANAPFFTATLAARARYSPAGSRAQVFVSMAGLKVAASSAGAAVTGGVIGALGPQAMLLAGAAITLAAVALSGRGG
jgi:hypothetical protein